MKTFVANLKRLGIIAFAGLFLLLSTGCSRPDLQSRTASPDVKSETSPMSDRVAPRVPAPRVSGNAGTYNDRVGQQTELYDPIQKPQGGMNNYSDVDPRVNKKASNDRATGLVRNARANVNRVDDPAEFAEDYRKGTPLGERTENVVEGVTEATRNTAKDVAEGTRQGLQNLKGTIETAKDGLQEGKDAVAREIPKSSDRLTQQSREGFTRAAEELNRNRAS